MRTPGSQSLSLQTYTGQVRGELSWARPQCALILSFPLSTLSVGLPSSLTPTGHHNLSQASHHLLCCEPPPRFHTHNSGSIEAICSKTFLDQGRGFYGFLPTTSTCCRATESTTLCQMQCAAFKLVVAMMRGDDLILEEVGDLLVERDPRSAVERIIGARSVEFGCLAAHE
jgi:hypothetical protein